MALATVLLWLAVFAMHSAGHAVGRMGTPPLSPWRPLQQQGLGSTQYTSRLHMCQKYWRDTTLDHFSWVCVTQARYMLRPGNLETLRMFV